MKAKCITNRSGYEHTLIIGKEYNTIDIQDGIFAGDYYVIADIGDDKTTTTHLHRFDISKEVAEAYVLEHHLDWRKANTYPSKTYTE